MNKLAIIIPYYKIDFFEETLQSLVAQTDKRFTIYIGNDASPNNPIPLIEKHLSDLSYFYFDYPDNVGGKNLAAQWERILQNVTEEWFQILGDDDTISENFVEEFYKNFENFNNVNFVKTSSEIINDNREVIYTRTGTIKNGHYSSIQFFLDKLNHKVNSSLSEHIFRSSEYKKIGFKKYPLAWHSDDYFLLEIAKNKPQFYFLANSKVIIKQTEKSISGKDDNEDKKQQATELFFKDCIKFFGEQNTSSEEKNSLTNYLICAHPEIRAKEVFLGIYSFPISLLKLGKYYIARQQKKY